LNRIARLSNEVGSSREADAGFRRKEVRVGERVTKNVNPILSSLAAYVACGDSWHTAVGRSTMTLCGPEVEDLPSLVKPSLGRERGGGAKGPFYAVERLCRDTLKRFLRTHWVHCLVMRIKPWGGGFVAARDTTN